MKLIESMKVEATPVDAPGAKDIKIRWVIDDVHGAKNFAMRIFDIAPGGHTPLHTHEWEHEIYIMDGAGEMVGENDSRTPLKPGDAVFVPGGELHRFQNAGEEVFRLMCLIPMSGKY